MKDALRDHFRIKHKVVGVCQEIHGGQITPRIGTEPGMILRQEDFEDNVFERGQHHISVKFPRRHAAFQELAAQHPRAKYGIAVLIKKRLHKLRYEAGIMLKVGMNHYHDIGIGFEGLGIAGLLIGPIPSIPWMTDRGNTQALGKLKRVVMTSIIDEDDVVYKRPGNLVDCAFERFLGIVCRQHDDDLLSRLVVGHDYVISNSGHSVRSISQITQPPTTSNTIPARII